MIVLFSVLFVLLRIDIWKTQLNLAYEQVWYDGLTHCAEVLLISDE